MREDLAAALDRYDYHIARGRWVRLFFNSVPIRVAPRAVYIKLEWGDACGNVHQKSTGTEYFDARGTMFTNHHL